MTEDTKLKEDDVIAKLDAFAELPDAPPKRKIKLSWMGKASVVVVAFWLVIIVIGPSIAPFHEMDMEGDDGFLDAYSGEYGTFYLGTDYIGRDTLSRILFGARNTIGISLLATLIAYLVGITLGILAAVKGGWIDMGISRVNDAILALPTIMLGLIVIAAFGSSILVLILTAALIYATSVFRIARALGQDIMVQDFVEAAHARGEGIWWIIRAEVLPNAAMPLATDFGLRLVFVVLFISSLSFLGLGIQPPASDWGSMVRENLQGLTYGSYAAIWPALAIASFTIAINLIVDDISAKSGGALAKKMV
ncbi:MAG: peptide/nickel transport system permease protein [Gammaproteobacteria bacterium]|jgi:peptide/nickel transport system permease protein